MKKRAKLIYKKMEGNAFETFISQTHFFYINY
jgi:hypothetical protein